MGVLLGALMVTGCQSTGGPPPQNGINDPDLYPAPVATPAESDPFAQPGVMQTPPAAAAPTEAPVFSVPAGPAPSSASPGGTYQVQKGDTLWSIAVSVYGNGQRWKDIAAANPGLNPDVVREGQVINLP